MEFALYRLHRFDKTDLRKRPTLIFITTSSIRQLVLKGKRNAFFANLTLLIDIFSMGFANYLVAKEERDHEHGEYGQRKSK